MSGSVLTPRFLSSARGRIFVLRRGAPSGTGGAVLIVPPFAEEMNKARKMFTDVAQGLAARGTATVIPDLYGTGDSDGEFRDADVDAWLADLARTAAWSAEQGWPIVGLLCMRTGCMLGARLARDSVANIARSVFWQPVTDGERFLTQFLRLRLAASMMDGAGAGKESAAGLRDRLRAGEALEVAGYELSGQLASQLSSLKLAPDLTARLGEVHWLEVVRSTDASLPGASQQIVDTAKQNGVTITAGTVVGEPFWSSTEIVRVPDLVVRTVDALAPLQ